MKLVVGSMGDSLEQESDLSVRARGLRSAGGGDFSPG